jgi:membrane fusion protein (multidrug efflux system)
MPTAFSRTSRALRADAFSSSLLRFALIGALLGAWSLWFCAARVTTVVTSREARLEVGGAARSLESVIGGAVVASRLSVGRSVEAGEVLVELDATAPRLELDRERTHLAGLAAELAALDRVADAEKTVAEKEASAATSALAATRALFREADSAARFAEDEEQRTARLRKDGTVSELEMARAHSGALQLRAAADALQEGVARVEREQEQHVGEREARRRELERDRIRLDGSIATSQATIELLARKVADLSIRAPVAGVLAEARELGAGQVIVAGERLASVVPAGALEAVARFEPTAAIGRLKPGLHAQMRLDAFPWAQYGALEAEVRSVASEVRDGAIRVELEPQSARLGAIALEHGMTGTVEVAVEETSPARLVLRWMGGLRGTGRTKP